MYATKTSLMISQYWFDWWLGVIRQQVLTWTNVDQVLRCYVASLGHTEYTVQYLLEDTQKILVYSYFLIITQH